jgi:PAS domain-containing protein
MAEKNWQAGGKVLIPALAVACLIGAVAPFGAARAMSGGFSPANVGSIDPQMIWEMLIGGIAVLSFLAAIVLWVLSALRKAKRSELRRNAFVRSALNNLTHGVVMTDARKRIVFCNDRFLELYGLARSDISKNMTGPELLELRL